MKLYLAPGACSLSPHIALFEAGLKFDTETVDIRVTKKTASGVEFKTINPKGYVPALQLDDGSLLTEGSAIVQYIADQKPEAKLAPANGTTARYHLQEWLNFVATEVHKNFGPLFRLKEGDEGRATAMANLGRRLDFANHALEGKSYLMGDTFTVADGYLFTVLSWSKHTGVDLSKWPNLVAFTARVAARPAVQQALKAEGLVQ